VFRLRTGKALGRDRKEVAVHFRSVPHLPFGHSGEALPNVLRFGLDPECLTLDLTGIGARAHTLAPLELTARIDPPELPAYGRLLLDVLNGNAALSIRGDEAEESWRVVAPVLSAWSKDSSRCWSTKPDLGARMPRRDHRHDIGPACHRGRVRPACGPARHPGRSAR